MLGQEVFQNGNQSVSTVEDVAAAVLILIDQLAIVASSVRPLPTPLVIDTMTAIAARRGIGALLIFTKADLAQVEELLQTQKESGVLEGYNFLPLEPVTPIDYVVPLLIAGVILLLRVNEAPPAAAARVAPPI